MSSDDKFQKKYIDIDYDFIKKATGLSLPESKEKRNPKGDNPLSNDDN
jgi:hypothetical protein